MLGNFELENKCAINRSKPVKVERMPLSMRERKMIESVTCTSLNSDSSIGDHTKTTMKSLSSLNNTNRAECKQTHRSFSLKTPKKHHSPKKSTGFVGDRFIPNRTTTQIALGQFLMSRPQAAEDDDVFLTSAQQNYRKVMNENLNGDIFNKRIIGYHQKPPESNGIGNIDQKAVYSSSRNRIPHKKSVRHIPSAPERVLDAPELLDDYYLNLLDWSSQNALAVCLGPCVYLWDASTGDINSLMEMEDDDQYISSVAWVKAGTHLAVGTSTNDVQLWDVERQKKVRSMPSHVARVGALSWNDHILTSGSRSGFINHHDVRMARHLIASNNAHSQEVCGLKWSPDGRYLASGGNDNVLNIFPNQIENGIRPTFTFTEHLGAVKALAWCPWQPNLLASGGGSADQHIRFWNCNIGSNLKNVNTRSQVCSLLWSNEYQELVSSHGYEFNQLTIWSYPKMEIVTELTGHTSRVLHMAMSPDGSVVVSAGADETLRLWKCFAVDPKKKKSSSSSSKPMSLSNAFQMIR